MFTLEQMQTLIAIVDEGSVTKAAKKIGKTKGAVSVMLGNLEDELGVQLFDRSGWQLELTEYGQKVYNQAKLLQRQAFHILSSSHAYAEGTEISLNLGIQNVIPAVELHSRLEVYRQLFPETRLHLVRGDDELLLQQLKSGELDLLIRVQSSAEMSPDLEHSNAGMLEFVYACAPDYSLSDLEVIGNEELLAKPQIILELGSLDSTEKQKVSYDTVVVDTREDFLYLVELGLGWCLLPKSIFQERHAQGGLCQIKPSFEGEHASAVMMEMLCSLEKVPGPALLSLKQAISMSSEHL
ncbi:LysR family transcriptional regulator [Photobacterium sanguinicancri]|uniref:LysR family transcriptional regulator n=1 Tax=Photobacterium sanguinicancri TaxID=875932 RepID=UPI002480A728|nr:LysR family transcriptional regulator [Photobacterium sanguinicancri]